jgi:hypothetical protein
MGVGVMTLNDALAIPLRRSSIERASNHRIICPSTYSIRLPEQKRSPLLSKLFDHIFTRDHIIDGNSTIKTILNAIALKLLFGCGSYFQSPSSFFLTTTLMKKQANQFSQQLPCFGINVWEHSQESQNSISSLHSGEELIKKQR